MATNSFNISYIIKAVDKFSPVVKKVQKSLKSLEKRIKVFSSKDLDKFSSKIIPSVTKLSSALGKVNIEITSIAKSIIKANQAMDATVSKVKKLQAVSTKANKKLAETSKKIKKTNAEIIISNRKFEQMKTKVVKVKEQVALISPKIKAVSSQTVVATSKAKRLGAAFRKVGEKAGQIGRGLALRVTAPIIAAGAVSIANAKKQIEAEEKVRQGVKLLGKDSAFTTDQLFKMASKLQLVSNFGDEDILEGATNALLRFKAIASDKEIFTQVQQSVIDIAAKTKKPLRSIADTLGRALQEPLTQLSLLERTVTFSTTQKEDIKALAKAGKLRKAQLIIIKAMRDQFSGFAKSQSETDFGRLNQATMALGDSSESLGKILAKSLVPLAGQVKKIALAFDSLEPSTKKNIVKFALMAAAIAPILITISLMIPAILALKTGLIALVTKALIPLGIFLLTNPLGLLITGIALVTTGIVLLVKNWDRIVFAIQKAVDIALVFFGIRDKRKVLGSFEESQIKKFLGEGDATAQIAKDRAFLSGGLNETNRAKADIRNKIDLTIRDPGKNAESIQTSSDVTTQFARGSNMPELSPV